MNEQSKPVIPKAYNGPKPQGIIPDIFIQDSFSKDDDRLWVPLSPGRWSRPLCFNISQGYWVHLTKVIGGGLPVGAFAARNEIMNYLSPLGPVYQAGTLSGNPLAMAAGYAMLSELNNDGEIFNRLAKKTEYLHFGMAKVLNENKQI